jgi:uncharacterized protein YcbK (DUF882 family)
MRHRNELIRVAILLCFLFSITVFGNDRDSRTLIRIANARSGQRIAVRLVTLFGTLNVRSRYYLSEMLSPEEAKRTTLLHPRLFLMLQRIADQFPGKTIEVVSGYRVSRTRQDDTHNLGRAVDFRVSGVKNSDLYEFAKTLPKCGTGYYPKANFVHLDVRDETVTWTDFFHTSRDCSVMTESNGDREGRGGEEIEFLSVWNDDKINLQLVTQNGIINSRSRQILSQMAASKVRAERVALLHPRLILMLQKVADEFPGHRFELISGYRAGERGFHSYHNYGRALDFRLQGVDNKQLYDFARTLPKCGTGYYPNSVFIHLDVRDKKTTWVDYSGVGEAAQYGKPK